MFNSKLDFESLETRSLLTCVAAEPCHDSVFSTETVVVEDAVETSLVQIEVSTKALVDLDRGPAEADQIDRAILNSVNDPVRVENQRPDALGEPKNDRPDPAQPLPSSYQELADQVGAKELAEILLANHETWGNYQGICGTGLFDMAQNYPDLYAAFLQTEQAIEQWLNGVQEDGGEHQQDEDSALPGSYQEMADQLDAEELAEILLANHATWGNYQGICGTALFDMAQNYPDLYAAFLQTEQAIAQWLNGLKDQPDGEEDEKHRPDVPEAPEKGVRPGDLDQDGNVGFSDFLILSSDFGTTSARADVDGDGQVGFADFLMLSKNFGDQGWKIERQDQDGDGANDAAFVDKDRDGIWDSAFIGDSDGDGYFFEAWDDKDDDGEWDQVFRDTDDDGAWNDAKFDTDGDGKFDREWIDEDGDQRIDVGEVRDLDPEEEINGPQLPE